MAPPNERTALLGGRSVDNDADMVVSGEVDSGQDYEEAGDSAIDDEEDEQINVLMSEASAPMASFGLGGGGDVFGTTFARRSSMSAIGASLQVPSHHQSATGLAARGVLSPMERREQRMTESTLARYQRRKSSVRKASTASVAQSDHSAEPDIAPPFHYNVTPAQFRWIFVGLNLTWFVGFFDSTLMASSHPVITSYFNASNSAAWLSTSFLLTSTAFQPMFGRISDMYGRKAPFVLSMTVFIVATVCCGVAQSIGQLIAARALCGFGAGGSMAMGSIIVADIVPLHRRAAYLAVLNTSLGISTALGASLGGFLADTLGWRWEFGIQVPALVACLLVTAWYLPANLGPMLAVAEGSSFRETLRELDLPGTVLLTVSVTSLMIALNVGGNLLAWDHPLIIAAFVVFALLWCGLLVVEYHTKNPIMPLRFLSRTPASNLIFSQFFGCMTMNAVLFNIPLYFQGTLLDTPTKSGTRLIVPFIISTMGSLGAGMIIQKTQQVMPCMIIGAVFILLGSVALVLMPQSLPDAVYTWIITISTLGQGTNFPTYSIGLLSVTPPDEMAVMLGTLFLFRNLGNVLGVAVSSLFSQNALLYYLERDVTGDDAAKIVEMVRESVEVIRNLPPFYRSQVIMAYAATLKITFAVGIVTSSLTVILLIGIQLPKLNAAMQNKAKMIASE